VVAAGEVVPSFELVDQDGAAVRSADLAGSWFLLYWYPKADTPGCTAQAEGLAAQIEVFDELGCVVLGASFDPPIENQAFGSRYGLPFRLLSDLDRRVAMAFGAAAGPDDRFARRVAHLVAPDGTVARSYEVDDPEFFAERVLDDLEDIQPSDRSDQGT
jgi:peroxiredoxin Q/BCP